MTVLWIYTHSSPTDWRSEPGMPSYISEGALVKVVWKEPGLLMLCNQNDNPPEEFLESERHLWRIGQ